MKVASAAPAAKITENSTNYGVSIGTVEAQLYSESGLDFGYFGYAEFVAKTSVGTYIGFCISRETVYDEESQESKIIEWAELVAIDSTEESVTIPDQIRIGDSVFPVTYIGRGYQQLSILSSCVKILTIPSTVSHIYSSYSLFSSLNAIYMLGSAPYSYWNIDVPYVYVCDESSMAEYKENDAFSQTTLLPYGWDFKWLTVNVNRKGEFAQDYLEMTDADWSAGVYVKITGSLNFTDLDNVRRLINLRKLDLSEADFDVLPNSFINGKDYLLEVKLPESVSSIPASAFEDCSRLSKVIAPNVESIGNYAFYGCNNLEEFDISNVSKINRSAFYNCSRFNPSKLSPELTLLGACAFGNTAVSKVLITEGLTSISNEVFYGCSQLTEVILPSSIESIGEYAFCDCSNLKDINLPEGITEIGDYAFSNCWKMSQITLPSTVRTIGYRTFAGCSSLLSIKCKAIVPPFAGGNFTYDMDLNHCTLYIAPFSIGSYREAQYWDAFYIMKPLNEPVKNIYINRPITLDLLSEDNAILQENPNMTLDYGYDSDYGTSVGQLSAGGDGTLSAGVFSIFHSIQCRQNYGSDYRTTLINNADNMRADSVISTLYLEKNRWHFISFQYDVKMEDIVGLNNTDFVIREYDSNNRASGDGTTNNWIDVTADGILKAGKGYIIQAANNTWYSDYERYAAVVQFPSRNTITKNNLFTSKDVAVSLEEYPSEFAHNRSWNLVGNPYPCYYDMHYLKDEFTTPIILWRGTNYQAYSPVDDDIILRPNEAFFVQRPVDKSHIIFGEEGRMHYDEAINTDLTPGVFYAPVYGNASSTRNVFNFNIEGCGYDDRTRIVINENASMEYEMSRDASKFFAETNEGVEIYVDGDIRYDICERPFESGVAALGVRIANSGTYTVSLNGRNHEGWSVMLTDLQTGACVDLNENSYEFEGEAGEATGRFLITFRTPEQNSIEEIAGPTDGSHVRIANVSGVIVHEGALADFMNSAPKGIYIVMDGKKSSKVVIQ